MITWQNSPSHLGSRTAGVVLPALLAVVCFTGWPAQAFSSFSDVRWIIHRKYVISLLRLDAEATKTYFDNPLANVQGGDTPPLPSGWKSARQQHYTSYAALERDIAAHAISAASVPVLLYDNERWTKTPREEQKNPCEYMARFTKLAHAHGFITHMAPDQNLAGPLVGITTYQGGESRNWQSYLRLGLAGCAARSGTERFHVMAQPFESHWGPTPEGSHVGGEAEFVNFVTQATLQAKAVNPKLVITCGLSTNPRYKPTAEIMYQESVDVRHLVDGFWLNWWGNPMGAAYLRLLSGPPPPPNSPVFFVQREGALDNRMPRGGAAARFNLATPGATLTSETSQTYPAGTVIPAGAWEFQFWTDGSSASAQLGLEFGYRASAGTRTAVIRSAAGWMPNVAAGAQGAADASGAFTTKTSTTLPPGGPYRLYWTLTVLKPGAFNLLYGSESAPSNLATPLVQPFEPRPSG